MTPMIETRDSYQPLLKNNPPSSPRRNRKKEAEVMGFATYGTLKGEALLHADNTPAPAVATSKNINGGLVPLAHQNTPQSVEPSGQYAEYIQPLSTIPVQHQQQQQQQQSHHNQTSNGVSPLSSARLPPAFPLRRRVDSCDRSVSELSTVSGASGHNRLQRSDSDGYDFVVVGNSVSPTYVGGSGSANNYASSIPPKPRRSRSPKPPRSRQGSRSPTRSNSMIIAPPPPHPLHQRRASDEFSHRHRRTNSYDVGLARGGGGDHQLLRRETSSNSLYSLNSSQGSMNSETLKLLPDPRWGGGSGGGGGGSSVRARSFSGGSQALLINNNNLNVSYSTSNTDSLEGRQFSYGSVGGGGKEVIMNGTGGGGGGSMMIAEPPMPRRHRRTNSEVSATSYHSGVSIDKSVEPVRTDMTKSSMFKGLTDQGVVKMQLPKDNFRLLSDRDLESGCVYKRALVNNEDDYFQDYHITTEDHHHAESSSLFVPTANPSDCQCTCSNCTNCHVRRKQLPPSYYVMAVDSDIYKRMFDEVAESMNMPCKLFYCGHHEDVDYPSIGIAVVGVVIIFCVMLWATVYVDG